MAECEEFHCDGECILDGGYRDLEWMSDLVQRAYTRVTNEVTDWTKCQTEPWWTLSGVLHGQTV